MELTVKLSEKTEKRGLLQSFSWLLIPLMAFLISRLIVLFAAYITEIAIPSISGDGLYHVDPNNIFLDVWARWDSGFYLSIANSGYHYAAGQQSNVAFFPVYPLLVNLVAPFVGGSLVSGVIISNACFLGTLIFLYKLTEFEFDSEAASRAVFYIAAFPTAFFFSAVYTESTFLLFSIGAFYFARKQEWGWAALFGMICSASRIVGVLSFGIVMLEWMRSQGWTISSSYKIESWINLFKGLKRDWLNVLVICLIPLGLLSYMIFLKLQFNDPIAFSSVQSAWGREMIGPWAVLLRDVLLFFSGDLLRGEVWYHIALDLLPTFAVFSTLIWMWRRLGESYAILSALSLLIPLSSGSQSLSRYVIVVFPFFMLLGYFGKYKLLDRSIMLLFSVFLGIFTALFVNWIFIA
jgi:hypothetical protein